MPKFSSFQFSTLLSMNSIDPNLPTLQVSKIAALCVKNNGDETEVILQKQCYKKVGGKTVIMKTEIDLTLAELELLCEAIKLLEYFLSIKKASSKVEPPKPPQRVTFA